MADILVIGSLNADLVVRTDRFPAPGETIPGGDLSVIPGGKGANQAVAAARLGSEVAMVGRVGADNFGALLLENLKQNRIDARGVVRDETAATGTAIIVVDAGGQNSIVLSPGANARLTPEDAGPQTFSKARLLLLQFEVPVETVVHAARAAKEKGLRVLLNPAPAHPIPEELLAKIDLLIPNETELSLLSGMPVRDASTAEQAARRLTARGIPAVIVTLGAKGALLVDQDTAKHIPAFKVDVVDTTAAGDAFVGGLAVALLKGQPLEKAVQYANACGALAVTKFGAQPSLPSAREVEEFLKK
jgi:ribokinase